MTGRVFLVAGLAVTLLQAGCAPPMTVTPTLTSGVSLSAGKRDPVRVFHLDDRIAQVVDFTWPRASDDGGVHYCEWKWFRAGRLVSDSPVRRIWFDHTPYTLHTVRPAGPLGVGRFTVETLVDDTVVATSAFTIVD